MEETPDSSAPWLETRQTVERALAGGRWEEAARALEALAALGAPAAEVAALRDRLAAARRRATDEALARARALLAQGRPRPALDALAPARGLAPGDREVLALEATVRRALQEVEARDRVRPLLERARRLAAEGRESEALAAAEEALRLAPDDGRALRLRDELAARRGAAPPPVPPPPPPEPRRTVPALLAAAREGLERDDLEAAETALREALELAPGDPEAETLRRQVRERRTARERARRVNQLLADARQFLQRGRLQAAAALLEELAQLDPVHPGAADLRAEVEARLQEAEARREAVRAAVAEGQAALATGDLRRAAERFEAALGLDAGHREARRALAEARARLAQQERVEMLLASARARLEQDELEGAEQDLRAALRLEPAHVEARALAERVWARRRELRRGGPRPAPAQASAAPAAPGTAARAEEPSRVAPGDPLAAARAALDEALRDPDPAAAERALAALVALGPDPDTAAASRALVAAHRERWLRDGLARAAALVQEGRPERALEVLAPLQAAAPDQPELGRLAARARRALEAREGAARVRALLERAVRLAAQERLDEALAAAEEAAAAAPDDARVLRLRDELMHRRGRRPGPP